MEKDHMCKSTVIYIMFNFVFQQGVLDSLSTNIAQNHKKQKQDILLLQCGLIDWLLKKGDCIAICK